MISKIGGVLLLRRLIEWSLTFDRRRKFYQKGMVWSTLGQLAELHKQLLEKRN
jgi:hypothetical protein